LRTRFELDVAKLDDVDRWWATFDCYGTLIDCYGGIRLDELIPA